jgi:hypothetical protein
MPFPPYPQAPRSAPWTAETAPPPPPPPRRRGRTVAIVAGVVVAVLALGGGALVAVNASDDSDGDAASPVSTLPSPPTSEHIDPNTGGDPLGDLGGLAGGGLDALTQCSSALSSAIGGGLGGIGPGSGSGAGDETLADDIDRLVATDESIRELQFTSDVVPEVVSPEELRRRVEDEVRSSYPADTAEADSRILGALGAVPAGTDMLDVQLEALGSQVAGFYDPETKSIVVGSSDPTQPLSADGEITMAHELDHALTDQALGLPTDSESAEVGSEDADLAAVGLVEGDATLVMTLAALQGFGTGDPLAGLDALMGDPTGLGAAQQAFADLPAYVQQQLMFPYTEGLGFVCALYADGGFDAVNDAYDNPPTTTAQILFPDRYLAGEAAVAPAAAPSPGAEWTGLPQRQFGAADLLWLLSAPGGDTGAALDAPRDRAGAWAGGTLQAYTRGADTALAIALVEHDGHDDLCDSMSQWADSASLSGSIEVQCDGDRIGIGIAPDDTTAALLAG